MLLLSTLLFYAGEPCCSWNWLAVYIFSDGETCFYKPFNVFDLILAYICIFFTLWHLRCRRISTSSKWPILTYLGSLSYLSIVLTKRAYYSLRFNRYLLKAELSLATRIGFSPSTQGKVMKKAKKRGLQNEQKDPKLYSLFTQVHYSFSMVSDVCHGHHCIRHVRFWRPTPRALPPLPWVPLPPPPL
jgi:hypothetical protein